MIVPNDATIAVIDGQRLRLFRNKGHEPHVDLVSLPTPELRQVSGGSGNHHRSSAANPDRSRLEEDNFVYAAADYLSNALKDGRILQLLVVADPRSLGELRYHFTAEVKAKLFGELAKDLTGHTELQIAAAISNA
jgi:protein required for attachment to host cells